MISKITELYIICRDIQVSTEKKQFGIEMISKMTAPCILCGDIQIPTEKSVQHRSDFKDQRILHSLLGHSNPKWKTQIIIQMITKMTDPEILCCRIQISIARSLHILLGYSNSNWKKQFFIQMTSKMTEPYIVWGTLKFQLKKKQFSIEMISKVTDPNILCRDIQNPTEKDNSVSKRFERSQNFISFVGTFKSQLKKTVHYRNDYKDDRTLHSLWGHSNSNWKRQFSIEMISKIAELYILWEEIQTPTEKHRLVLKWLQRWQNITFFVGTFKFRLKKTVQYQNDFKDHRTIHPL